MDLTQILAAFLASALGAGTFLRFFSEKMIEASFEKVIHREMLLTEADLQFRQRQLEEFYGPLYASLKLNAQIYEIWNRKDNQGQPEHILQDVNQQVIDLFHHNNQEAIQILKTKAHLVDGAELPPEFVNFMTSATLWGMYCTRRDQPWIPAELEVKIPQAITWPAAFEAHIYEKTEELKRTLDELLLKYRAK